MNPSESNPCASQSLLTLDPTLKYFEGVPARNPDQLQTEAV